MEFLCEVILQENQYGLFHWESRVDEHSFGEVILSL